MDKIVDCFAKLGVKLDMLAYARTAAFNDLDFMTRPDADRNGVVNFVLGSSDGRVVLQRYDTGNVSSVAYRLYLPGGVATTPSSFLGLSPAKQRKILES